MARDSIRQPRLELEGDVPRPRRRRRPTFNEELLARGVPVPHEEVYFAKLVGREWRFDYCWPTFKVAYEYEGGTFSRGRSGHNSGAGIERDCEKYNRAQVLGWLVIRGTAKSERNGQALEAVVDALRFRGWRTPDEPVHPVPRAEG